MPAHTPNRALNRAQLETIAWRVTPGDYRGGSGSRRSMLVNSPQGTTLQPLSDMTDNQIRKYIGPKALEEGGDMRKNGSPETAPKFRPGDQVTDLDESMEGTVMYVTTNGPFDKVPYRCLVQETSGGRYRERPWGENQLKLLRGGPGSFDMRPNAKAQKKKVWVARVSAHDYASGHQPATELARDRIAGRDIVRVRLDNGM